MSPNTTISIGNLTPRAAGPRTKLTPKLHQSIVKRVAKGATCKDVAKSCGIPKQTLDNWLRWGEEHSTLPDADIDSSNIYYRLYIDTTAAEHKLKSNLARHWLKIVTSPTSKRKRIYKQLPKYNPDGTPLLDEEGRQVLTRYLASEEVEETGDGDYRGIEAYMGKRWAEWSKRSAVEITGANGGPVQINSTIVTLDLSDLEELPLDAKRAILAVLERKQLAAAAVEVEVEAKGTAEEVLGESTDVIDVVGGEIEIGADDSGSSGYTPTPRRNTPLLSTIFGPDLSLVGILPIPEWWVGDLVDSTEDDNNVKG